VQPAFAWLRYGCGAALRPRLRRVVIPAASTCAAAADLLARLRLLVLGRLARLQILERYEAAEHVLKYNSLTLQCGLCGMIAIRDGCRLRERYLLSGETRGRGRGKQTDKKCGYKLTRLK